MLYDKIQVEKVMGVIKNSLKEIEIAYSVSLKKLDEMKKRLDSGYTSFWS